LIEPRCPLGIVAVAGEGPDPGAIPTVVRRSAAACMRDTRRPTSLGMLPTTETLYVPDTAPLRQPVSGERIGGRSTLGGRSGWGRLGVGDRS
jgi:hypothetical protein